MYTLKASAREAGTAQEVTNTVNFGILGSQKQGSNTSSPTLPQFCAMPSGKWLSTLSNTDPVKVLANERVYLSLLMQNYAICELVIDAKRELS